MEYTRKEMMVSLCAKEIRDFETVFIGVGIPLLSGMLALRSHAPSMTMIYEAGGIGAVSRRIPWTISDSPTTENALAATEMWRVMSDTQRGFVQLGVIGGAQVDKYGNVNSTVIIGENNSYEDPLVRLPGSGGANDIASSCQRTVLIMPLQKRRFVEKVDYITSPGYLSGGEARKEAGLLGGGPVALITDHAVFRFDPVTKEMYLDELYPGITVNDVANLIDWDLKISPDLREAKPPTPEEIKIMQELDPLGIILDGKNLQHADDFESFYRLMKQSYQNVVLDL
jgi:glutaconate CoA-transferase, subunit B